MRREKDSFVVSYGNGEDVSYDNVVIATGLTGSPNYPAEPFWDNFSGTKIHAGDYHSEADKFAGKKVLIIGGGEFASDIAVELSGRAEVIMSIKGGQWFQSKILGADFPADMFYNRYVHKLWYWWALHVFGPIVELVWGKGGSGIAEWAPHSGYLNGPYNKSREVITKVAQGDVVPKGEVTDVNNKQVTFSDGSTLEPDVIIFATGYTPRLPFEIEGVEADLDNRYKHVFPAGESSLAFIGYVRPYLGSIPMLAELQARMIAGVFVGKTRLPQVDRMKRLIIKDQVRCKREFPADAKRLPFIVNPFDYCDDIACHIGSKPNTWLLFFTDNKLWRSIVFQPWSPFQWSVHGVSKEKRTIALEQIAAINDTNVARTAWWFSLLVPIATVWLALSIPLVIILLFYIYA